MVMSEVACLVQTSHQVKHGECENTSAGLATSAARRPRSREVTSRYKSSPTTSVSPALVPNRRFPTPNGDRATTAPDVPSPKRAQSAERRRPSPTRTAESKALKGSIGTAPMTPQRPGVRTELLWPSTRSLSTSMQYEPQSLPPNGQAKRRIDSRGKASSVAADHSLRPSANVLQRSADCRKPTSECKPTPLHCQNIDQVENARPQENIHKLDQHHWPGSSNVKMSGAALSRSVDLSANKERPLRRAASPLVQRKPVYGSSRVPRPVSSSRALSQSINEGTTFSSGSQTGLESKGRRRDSPVKTRKSSNKDSPPNVGSHPADRIVDQVFHPARHTRQAVELARSESTTFTDNTSDTDSISSGGTTTTSSSGRGMPGSVLGTRGIQGTTVSARVWQDARSRCLSENSKLQSSIREPDLSPASVGRIGVRYKTMESPQGSNSVVNRAATLSSCVVLPNRSVSDFLPPQRPPSPARASPYRSIPSPSRSRGGPPLMQSQRSSSAAVMLNFGADIRKVKKGLSQVEEIHFHRILHNRLLQWRFVNARAEGAMDAQIFSAENSLYNVCARVFDLRSTVTAKKTRLQQTRQAQKLNSLLSVQAPKLEDWSNLQNEHSIALKGAVQALEAAVLRVPVTGGVKADALAVKEAISSAFDVMNSVENSVAYLFPKADKTNSLVSELGYVAAQERVLLEECADLLAMASALEIEECSMRTHLIQSEHERARVLGHL